MRSLAWCALAALVLTAPEAGAQLGAQSYVRSRVTGQVYCVFWSGREFVYRVDSAGSSRTPGDSEFAAIEAAFASWSAVSDTCSDFIFTRGPDIQNPKVGYVKNSKDNENLITFREVDCSDVVPKDDPCSLDDTCPNVYACWDHGAATIALTTSSFYPPTGKLYDADIEFNASRAGRGFLFTTVDSPPCDLEHSSNCVVADLQNTLTHEIGHAVGLDHVLEPGSTMEPTAPPGETHKRIIDVGSAAGFCDTYPRGLPPTQCGERPELGRNFKTVSNGTGMGCGAAPSALPAAALLGILAFVRRRERPPGRRDEAAPRTSRD